METSAKKSMEIVCWKCQSTISNEFKRYKKWSRSEKFADGNVRKKSMEIVWWKCHTTIRNGSKTSPKVYHLDQNHRKSCESWKIVAKSSLQFQSAVSNAPKPDQDLKNTKKLHTTIKNVPKTRRFWQNPGPESSKSDRNRWFSWKIMIFRMLKMPHHDKERLKNVTKTGPSLRTTQTVFKNWPPLNRPSVLIGADIRAPIMRV